ncbi:MAG TPA: AbrB/MazE/SpoVT family DNA-binding domain-containing protein [Acidimicrobiales bacterium]|nr:AbrB/MazE/SpoVT family DNA-binding domain-containing protein [Acidimicrobiales bacterium]
MSSAGIPRTIDRLGRIVVPVEFRRALGIGDHDLVEISLEGDRLVMVKLERMCTFCGATVNLRQHRSKLVCTTCISQLSSAARAARWG